MRASRSTTCWFAFSFKAGLLREPELDFCYKNPLDTMSLLVTGRDPVILDPLSMPSLAFPGFQSGVSGRSTCDWVLCAARVSAVLFSDLQYQDSGVLFDCGVYYCNSLLRWRSSIHIPAMFTIAGGGLSGLHNGETQNPISSTIIWFCLCNRIRNRPSFGFRD